MAKTDPRLAEWMILEIEVELDREYEYKELAKEVARRIKEPGAERTFGVYFVKAVRLSSTKATFKIGIREAKWLGSPTALQEIRSLLFGVLSNIAKDVAEINRIQLLRKLLPEVKSTCTGM